ncbi:hypothetical protein GGR25_003437 [Kaistia hirudinis]|uniref:Uncharacterized protein n=1 Tax=Kaistia hirudinis TaxID=1293440 RepID=A0A840AQ26_9HYPH|nr:hypothetical protein [Kaistia hirudinis]MBB3932379.1 hypothetical protein [Kaistia hirudinis]
MKHAASRLAALAFAAVAGFATLTPDPGSFMGARLALAPQAEAVVGRPLTPMSYAGVARRTTYRAATTPVVVVPPPVVVVAPRPGCYQVANSYGQLYWRCP